MSERAEAAFVRGDESALRAVYDVHGSLIYSYCRRHLDESRSKDVVQDVFVSAWRARMKFDPERGTLAAWLMGIAKNRLIDNVRSENRHADRRSGTESLDADVKAETEAEIERIADRMLVAEAMTVLPDRSRTAIELAYFGGMSQTGVAQHMDVPLGTVKSDIRRGLAILRRHLGASDD